MFSEDLRRPIHIFPIDILLIEDNAGDIFLIENALSTCSTSFNLYLAEDGEIAMRFLHQEGVYSTSPCPQLIMLDLNLPEKDGREVLAEIKAAPKLKHIPVIVMTTSSAEQDILRSYQLCANCYITKPTNFDQYNQTIQSIANFWLNYVQIPAKPLTDKPQAFSGQPLLLVRSFTPNN